jgi:hypothetical protein
MIDWKNPQFPECLNSCQTAPSYCAAGFRYKGSVLEVWGNLTYTIMWNKSPCAILYGALLLSHSREILCMH